eukprot:13795168-Heterocapsa_arctica.AAC.1
MPQTISSTTHRPCILATRASSTIAAMPRRAPSRRRCIMPRWTICVRRCGTAAGPSGSAEPAWLRPCGP